MEFFTSNCYFCLANTNNAWCKSCEQDFIEVVSRCQICACQTYNTTICGNCTKKPPVFASTEILFDYKYPARELIKSFKFNNQPELARAFASKLAKKFVGRNLINTSLIPVPLHKTRQRERGYNQSLEFAKHLAKELNLRIDASLCFRIKNTDPQSGLPKKTRKNNVKNAFTLSNKLLPEHLIIVDDVITTGATVNEIAKLFINAGCKRVDIWAIART